MRKVFLILIICSFFKTGISATKVKGYYISRDFDTVKVTFNIRILKMIREPDFEEMQLGVEFFDSLNQRHFLDPPLAREIYFECMGKRCRMLAVTFTKSRPNAFFLQLIKEGKLKLFKFYYKNEMNYKMQKDNGEHFQSSIRYMYSDVKRYYLVPSVNGVGASYGGSYTSTVKERDDPFADDMSVYLSDCPALSKKIEQLVYVREDIEKIVDEYNTTCK